MSAITTIAALPLLIIVLMTTLELGSLRVVAARARSAADLAVLVAVNDQDDGELQRSGTLVAAADAADVARTVFAANLDPLAPFLAATPADVAADAAIQVEPKPATVHLRVTVPVRTPLFGALFFHPITDVAVQANGGAR
ncbi:MAG TPA: pilus assembly protein TadG-related protein [Candidatus Saccharimonadales bacterium]|nr:pilus assembly protein TadG-related protein [Candidatus Saccharimonadales bacterium]